MVVRVLQDTPGRYRVLRGTPGYSRVLQGTPRALEEYSRVLQGTLRVLEEYEVIADEARESDDVSDDSVAVVRIEPID